MKDVLMCPADNEDDVLMCSVYADEDISLDVFRGHL